MTDTIPTDTPPEAHPAPERQVAVKGLSWHPYDLTHEYGKGSWGANGGSLAYYEILDVGSDGKNGLRYYLRGMAQFETLDAAKAAAQADYEQRILSALTHPLASHEGDAVPRGLDTAERVRFYEHDFYPLSNFSAFSLRIWGGIRFDTSEAAYHWAKFDLDLPAAREVQNNIYHSRSAHDAFKIAEENKRYRRPDWDDVKVDKMRKIIRAKADQHEYVRRKLLATGDRELVEDSWRDDFWGWGENRDGQNMLGKLWMEVRAEIRAAFQAAQPVEGETK